jgi:hypothetical protein
MEFNPDKLYRFIPEPSQQPSKRNRRIYKRWKSARFTTMGKLNEVTNMLTEKHFMKVRAAVKELYAQQNEYFYDHDYRNDTTESSFTMHVIACSTFYMILDCDFCCEYTVQYDIESSPFKDQIVALIHDGMLRNASKAVPMQPNMQSYFQYIRLYRQDNPKFFSHLSADKEQNN